MISFKNYTARPNMAIAKYLVTQTVYPPQISAVLQHRYVRTKDAKYNNSLHSSTICTMGWRLLVTRAAHFTTITCKLTFLQGSKSGLCLFRCLCQFLGGRCLEGRTLSGGGWSAGESGVWAGSRAGLGTCRAR